MKINAIEKLRQAARQLKSRFDRKALILMYHRVAEVESDPWSLCVTAQNFSEHLEILQKWARPMPLKQFVQALDRGQLANRAIVITFDDGYADALDNAKPLLERYDLPATVFLTTGYLGQGRQFWWDELERLLLHPRMLPEALRLNINGSDFQWELGEAACDSEEAYQRDRTWKACQNPPSARHALYHSLWERLRLLPEGKRRTVQEELLAWAMSEPKGDLCDRPLSLQEVAALAQGELIEIGSHAVTHPMLSSLTLNEQREEIQQSRAYLEEFLDRPVTGFAYPYGCYSSETVAMVQEAGFAYACCTSEGLIKQETARFELPRVQVQDWDGDEFAKRLSMWFDS